MEIRCLKQGANIPAETRSEPRASRAEAGLGLVRTCSLNSTGWQCLLSAWEEVVPGLSISVYPLEVVVPSYGSGTLWYLKKPWFRLFLPHRPVTLIKFWVKVLGFYFPWIDLATATCFLQSGSSGQRGQNTAIHPVSHSSAYPKCLAQYLAHSKVLLLCVELSSRSNQFLATSPLLSRSFPTPGMWVLAAPEAIRLILTTSCSCFSLDPCALHPCHSPNTTFLKILAQDFPPPGISPDGCYTLYPFFLSVWWVCSTTEPLPDFPVLVLSLS